MTPTHSKPSVLKAFAQPAALTMLFFGFSSGLPFLLVAGTLAFWLKESGIALENITLLAGAGMSYSLKFLWAPMVDRLHLPLVGRLGQRRGWILAAQILVLAGLCGMALISPAQMGLFVALTLVVAFAGATQDIAIDAYRIEIAPLSAQGALLSTYSLGYRIGLILAGAAALVLADHASWSLVYNIMAASMLIPIAANFWAREPAIERPAARGWAEAMNEGVVQPFADFFRRFKGNLGIGLLLFILLFKISDQALGGGIISPFYLDSGYSKTEIATITKFYGVWINLAGTFLGGIVVARWGVERTIMAAMIFGAVSNLLYLLLIGANGNLALFTLVISGENFAGGFLGTAAVAYLSALVNKRYTATQYALFSSLITLPGKLVGLFSGRIVKSIGYANYFELTAAAILPAVILFLWLRPRLKLEENMDNDQESTLPSSRLGVQNGQAESSTV